MLFEVILMLCLSLLVGGLVAYKSYRIGKQEGLAEQILPAPIVSVDLSSLHRVLQELPNKVLQSVVNSSNTHKGALGELIGYIRLQAEYDRIIPIGSITDFICIKLPTSSRTGKIDFVDIKTGKNAKLSKEQRALRDLIKAKEINFVELKIKELSEAPSSKS